MPARAWGVLKAAREAVDKMTPEQVDLAAKAQGMRIVLGKSNDGVAALDARISEGIDLEELMVELKTLLILQRQAASEVAKRASRRARASPPTRRRRRRRRRA